MIVGILGRYESDSRLFYEFNKFLSDNFVIIDSDVMSKVIGIGGLVNCTKKCVLLKKLESVWGNVCIVGNLFIDDEVISSVINSGGKIFSLQFPNKEMENKKWDNPKTKLDRNVILVFEPDCKGKLSEYLKGCEGKREVANMTIEESIKKAMIELGIKPNEDSESTPNNESEPLENYEEIERNPIKVEEESIEDFDKEHIEIQPEVFLKIKDGKIALFIPEGVEFNKKIIGDISYSVLAFKAPDLGNTGLQPLKIEV